MIVSRKGNTKRNGKSVEMTLHPEKWLKDRNIESAWYNTPKCPSIQSIKGKKVVNQEEHKVIVSRKGNTKRNGKTTQKQCRDDTSSRKMVERQEYRICVV